MLNQLSFRPVGFSMCFLRKTFFVFRRKYSKGYRPDEMAASELEMAASGLEMSASELETATSELEMSAFELFNENQTIKTQNTKTQNTKTEARLSCHIFPGP